MIITKCQLYGREGLFHGHFLRVSLRFWSVALHFVTAGVVIAFVGCFVFFFRRLWTYICHDRRERRSCGRLFFCISGTTGLMAVFSLLIPVNPVPIPVGSCSCLVWAWLAFGAFQPLFVSSKNIAGRFRIILSSSTPLFEQKQWPLLTKKPLPNQYMLPK